MATVRGHNVIKKKRYTTLASPPNLKLNDSFSERIKKISKKKILTTVSHSIYMYTKIRNPTVFTFNTIFYIY